MSIYLSSYYPNFSVGLCNYLKILFSTYRINKIINPNNEVPCVDKEFDWIFKSIYSNDEYIYPTLVEECPWCTIDNWSIFLENGINHTDGRKNYFNQSDKVPVYKTNGWRFFIQPSDNVGIGPFNNEWHCRDQASNIDLRFTKIPESVRKTYLDIIKKFDIIDSIKDQVNKEFNRIDGEYIGVHIRTWFSHLWTQDEPENIPQYKWYQQVRGHYVEAINRNPIKKVLICTDNKQELELLLPYISKDKEIIYYDPTSDLSRMQNDFCELLLLSKGKHLIGTNNSTFSELAWWYGDCKQTVEIF